MVPPPKSRALFDSVVDICRRRGATTIEVAQTDEQRARIWRGRKAAFAAMGRVSPNYYVQDGVVPRTRLPEVLEPHPRSSKQRSGLRIGNVFHAGDGNLHPLICYDERIPGQSDAAVEVAGRDPDVLHRGGRLAHRRARHRRRQVAVHADDVHGRRSGADAARARRRSIRRASAIRAKCFPRRGCAARCPDRTARIRSRAAGLARAHGEAGQEQTPRSRARHAAEMARRSLRRASRAAAVGRASAAPEPRLDWGRPPQRIDAVLEHARG